MSWLTAPSRWPAANSSGVRTSMTVSRSPKSCMSGARRLRGDRPRPRGPRRRVEHAAPTATSTWRTHTSDRDRRLHTTTHARRLYDRRSPARLRVAAPAAPAAALCHTACHAVETLPRRAPRRCTRCGHVRRRRRSTATTYAAPAGCVGVEQRHRAGVRPLARGAAAKQGHRAAGRLGAARFVAGDEHAVAARAVAASRLGAHPDDHHAGHADLQRVERRRVGVPRAVEVEGRGLHAEGRRGEPRRQPLHRLHHGHRRTRASAASPSCSTGSGALPGGEGVVGEDQRSLADHRGVPARACSAGTWPSTGSPPARPTQLVVWDWPRAVGGQSHRHRPVADPPGERRPVRHPQQTHRRRRHVADAHVLRRPCRARPELREPVAWLSADRPGEGVRHHGRPLARAERRRPVVLDAVPGVAGQAAGRRRQRHGDRHHGSRIRPRHRLRHRRPLRHSHLPRRRRNAALSRPWCASACRRRGSACGRSVAVGVIVTLQGTFSATAPDRFTPITPVRIASFRAADATIPVPGGAGLDAAAVTLAVDARTSTAGGTITVTRCGTAAPVGYHPSDLRREARSSARRCSCRSTAAGNLCVHVDRRRHPADGVSCSTPATSPPPGSSAIGRSTVTPRARDGPVRPASAVGPDDSSRPGRHLRARRPAPER